MTKALKAIVGALIAGLTAAQVALDSASPVSTTQWVTLVVGVLIAALGVYAVPNTSVTPAPPAPPASPPTI